MEPLFATGLSYPSDVMAWRKGVLVTAAPRIWYFEDTDKDGKELPLLNGPASKLCH